MDTQTVPSAQERLVEAAMALASAIGGAQHDLWVDDQYNVAPTRMEAALRLRSIPFDAWSPQDLDFVMFKCMTTMGGEATFRCILPPFLVAVAKQPFYGWASGPHVLLSKLDMIDLQTWRSLEISALAKALAAFADLEIAGCNDDRGDPPGDAVELLARSASMLGSV